MVGENTKNFNYDSIPLGFYDKVLDQKDGMRKFWHWHKFDSVKRALTISNDRRLVDIGCFAGTFIGRFLKGQFLEKVGADILKDQINFAELKYRGADTRFVAIDDFSCLPQKFEHKFSNITLIEVIEHLDHGQIRSFFENVNKIADMDAELILTTPNYFSIWPVLEFIVNRVSSVKYEEQHITKFTYFNIEKKLELIVPNFKENFKVEYKTTSHFLSPFIACWFYSFAIKLSQLSAARKWKNPLGAMILIKVVKIS